MSVETLHDLWDVEAGNLIGTFETRAAALAIVHELVILNGPTYAESLQVGSQTQDDSPSKTQERKDKGAGDGNARPAQ